MSFGLSVNIKDTAGRGVLIKPISVDKQLINKRRPSPLPVCLPVFSILWAVSITPRSSWMATSVYYAHGSIGGRHNDTVDDTPPIQMLHSHPSCDLRGWLTYFSGSEAEHGKESSRFLLMTGSDVSLSCFNFFFTPINWNPDIFPVKVGRFCPQAPSTWSISCLMTMCFTCWSLCTVRREPTTWWGPWRARGSQVSPQLQGHPRNMQMSPETKQIPKASFGYFIHSWYIYL